MKNINEQQTQETTQNKEDQTMNNNNFSDIIVKDGYRLIAYVERGSLADAIIYRESVSNYVVCLGYDRTDGTWRQGRYTGKNRDEAYRILADRIKPDSDYDYRAAIIEDVREYINNISLSEYADKDEAREALYDEMWCADDVTGNGSGSYWFSTYKAEAALMHNLDLLGEAVEEFGGDMDVLSKGAEACDVTIRCYLLGEALDTVLDEIDEPTAWKEA